MNWLVVLPVLVPLASAVLSLLTWRSRRMQRRLAVLGTGVLLLTGGALLMRVWTHGIQVVQIGSWPAPFGITLVADHLSAVMVAVTGLIGLAGAVFSVVTIDGRRERFAYYPLFHILLMGVCGTFIAGDLFNLYVWFEVMLIASFVLLVLGNEPAQVRAAVKYAAINLVASFCLLAAIGLLYGLTGSLNLADLAVRMGEIPTPGLATTLSMLFLIAFGIKASLFPLFFWLPASYHTPPIAVTAVFAGLLTKVGVYALIRVFTLLFTHDVGYTHTILLVVAGLTMVTGVLGAAAQHEIRRILSFHIISQIGYMIMGLALFTPLALAGAVFYVVHHIIVKANLFLVGGVAHHLTGSYDLDEIGGLYQSQPVLAVLFLVPAFSLAGLPPLSGFWAKLILVKAGLDVASYTIVAIALLVGVLTLFSMTKIWTQAFWRPAPATGTMIADIAVVNERRAVRSHVLMLLPVAGLALLTLAIGLWAQPLFALAERAAAELLDPSTYIQAVLSGF